MLERAQEIWWLFALMQPLNGAVFALDGILIGAGDGRYLMWSMVAAFARLRGRAALAALAFDWGIVGVWAALFAADLVRLALMRRALPAPRAGSSRAGRELAQSQRYQRSQRIQALTRAASRFRKRLPW